MEKRNQAAKLLIGLVIVILAGLAGYLISLIPKAEQDLSNKKGGRS